jgi:hypothetical protein
VITFATNEKNMNWLANRRTSPQVTSCRGPRLQGFRGPSIVKFLREDLLGPSKYQPLGMDLSVLR